MKQSSPGFELGSLNPFPTTITVTLSALPIVCKYSTLTTVSDEASSSEEFTEIQFNRRHSVFFLISISRSSCDAPSNSLLWHLSGLWKRCLACPSPLQVIYYRLFWDAEYYLLGTILDLYSWFQIQSFLSPWLFSQSEEPSLSITGRRDVFILQL